MLIEIESRRSAYLTFIPVAIEFPRLGWLIQLAEISPQSTSVFVRLRCLAYVHFLSKDDATHFTYLNRSALFIFPRAWSQAKAAQLLAALQLRQVATRAALRAEWDKDPRFLQAEVRHNYNVSIVFSDGFWWMALACCVRIASINELILCYRYFSGFGRSTMLQYVQRGRRLMLKHLLCALSPMQQTALLEDHAVMNLPVGLTVIHVAKIDIGSCCMIGFLKCDFASVAIES